MEQDLRGHFELALADEPPPPAGYVEAARVEGARLRRRSRLRAGAGAGLLAVALVGGINVFGGGGTEPVTPAPAAAGPYAGQPICIPPTDVAVFLADPITDADRDAIEGVLAGDATVQKPGPGCGGSRI